MRSVPDYGLGLDASGSFTRGVSMANQIIDNRLRREQQQQNYNIQDRQIALQEQEAQQKIQQQRAFQTLAQEYYNDPSKVGPILFAQNPQAAAQIAENAQQQYSSQYNTLTLLTKDTKAEDKQAVYDILRPELQKQFPELEFGDKVSSELMSSLKARASTIKAKMKTNLEFKDTAQGIVGFNQQTGEATPTGFASKTTGTEGGGALGYLARQIMRDNPKMNFTQALQMAQTGFRQGTKLDENGNIVSMGGALEATEKTEEAKSYGKESGKSKAEAAVNLGKIIDNSNFILQNIDALENSPGLAGAIGLKGGGASFQNVGSDKIIPGSPEADFLARYKQVQGEAFLQAFQVLKGGGQITEIEGEKATKAIARMDAAQSEKEFKAALNDFRQVIKVGTERARKQAKGEWGADIDSKSAGASSSKYREGQTATNPKTGLTLTFKGGKWQ